MIEVPDRYEIGAALLMIGLIVLCLAPIIERAETVFAFFDLMERGFK